MANFFTRVGNAYDAARIIYKRSGGFLPTGQTTLGSFFSFMGVGNKAKVVVTAETALKLSTFFTCVRSISEDIAKLPFKIQIKDSKGNKTDVPSHPAAVLFNQRPNQINTPFTLKQVLIERALRKGNGYAFINRDNDGFPIELFFLENETVTPVLKDRKLFYVVNDPLLGLNGTFSSEFIFHLRGFGNGFIGLSVIQYASESLGTGLALQEYGGKFFGDGANMTGLLSMTGLKSETEVKTVKQSFLNSYSEDGIAAIHGNTTFTKMNVDPNEAQFVESNDAKVNDIARWFRMPLGKLQKDNVTDIEALEIQYVNDTLMPWIIRFEQECELKLISNSDRPFYEAKIATEMLLRGDSAALERRLKTFFYTGMQTPNQMLRAMDMNTIGSEGDRYYVPINMIPADMVTSFWQSKTPSNIPLNSPDASGTGNSNGNINQSQE